MPPSPRNKGPARVPKSYGKGYRRPKPSVGSAIQRAAQQKPRPKPKPKSTRSVGRTIQRTAKREKSKQQIEEMQRDLLRKIGGPNTTVLRQTKTGARKQADVDRRAEFNRELARVLRGGGQVVASNPVRAPKRRGGLLATANPIAAVSGALKAADKIASSKAALIAGGPLTLPAQLVGRAGKNIGQAFVEAPGRTAAATAKGFRDTVTGIPGGLVSAATDPAGTLEQTVKDYSRRYGPLLGDAKAQRKYRERIKKEGAAGEILDAAGAGAIAEATVGRAAMTAARKRGAKVATQPRPKLRTSGGQAREQPIARTLGKALVQRKVDQRRARGVQRQVSRGDADAVVVEAAKRGEVTKLSKRARARAQRRDVARGQGRARQSMIREQTNEIGGLRRGVAAVAKSRGVKVRDQAIKEAVQHGITSPEAARRILPARIKAIETERAATGVRVGRTDELPALRTLLANPELFTPEVARVAREQRARGVRGAASDPTINVEQARLRAAIPQAQVLGLERGGVPIKAAQARARERVKAAKAERKRAGRRVVTATRRAAREQGRADILERESSRAKQVEHAKAAEAKALAHYQEIAARPANDIYGNLGAERKAARELEAATARRKAVARGGSRAGARHAAARKALEEALDRSGRAERMVKATKKAERGLRAAANKGKKTVNAEPVARFVERTTTAAKELGAEPAGYYPSKRNERQRSSSRAVGAGAKAVQADKRYKGTLHRSGREDASTTTLEQGVAQNIKRKHNYNLVADTVQKHALPWSLGKDGKGLTIKELEDLAEDRGVDLGSLGFMDPQVFAARRKANETDNADRRDVEGDDPSIGGQGARSAFEDATIKPGELKQRPEDFDRSRRYVAYPKAVHDELDEATKSSGAVGRSLDIARGKQVRVLLNLSPAWLQYQVASNAMLAGLAGTGPVSVLRANLQWWRGLTDEQKAAIEPYVGVGAFRDAAEQTRLGAASDAKIVNAYRAFKANDFWHRPRRGPVVRATGKGKPKPISDRNPMDWLPRIDTIQNNTFRRAVLYSQVKRDAYRRMGENATALQKAQDRLVGALGKDPTKFMDEVIADPRALERHADHVNDFLGDYLTYTARERRYIARNVMFYGFLRFSLRFTFYTMPVKHPIMTSIIGQLGRMQTEEVRKLLGGDELPFALGRFYWAKNGELQSVDVSRANPALNTLTAQKDPFSNPQALIGFLPPVAVSVLDQMYSKSSFKGREFRVQGRPQAGDKPLTMEDRGRIFFEQMVSLAAPYRSVKKATGTGAPEGEDSSLILGRRYTQYKKPELLADIEKDKSRRPQTLGGRLVNEFVPFKPRRDYSPEIAEDIRAGKAKENGKGSKAGSGKIDWSTARPAGSVKGVDWSTARPAG